jgi:poly(hydroxyalkanoate) granule-associated protein
MVTKVNKSAPSSSGKAKSPAASGAAQMTQVADAIRDSAQQIWQAGLGAFAKAQEGRSKVFDSLVQEGLSMQRKTQAAAEERINAATNKVTDMANDITAKATGQWDKLESIFEERVAKALKRLGLPSAKELADMKDQLEALTREAGKVVSTTVRNANQASKAPAKAATKSAAKAKATVKSTVKAATAKAVKPVAKAAAPAKKAVAKKAVVVKKAVTKQATAAKKAVQQAAQAETE